MLLENAQKLVRSEAVVDKVDPDRIDQYFEAIESFQEALGAADSLAYSARTDFGSTESRPRVEIEAGANQRDGKVSVSTLALLV